MSDQPDHPMRRKSDLEKRRDYGQLIAYIFVVVSFLVNLGIIQNSNDRNIDRIQEQAAVDDLEICLFANENRDILRQLVQYTAQDDGLDLTLVAGFSDLDPATQTFFQNLSDSTSGNNRGERFRDFAETILVKKDCPDLDEPKGS